MLVALSLILEDPMPATFNQAVSAAETLPEDCDRATGFSEVDSQRKQEFARRQIQGLELRLYTHCYGD